MFRHIGIVVSDIDTQLKFYKDLLNLEVYYDKVEKGEFLSHIIDKSNLKAHVIKLGKNSETIVELLKFEKKPRLAFPGKSLFQKRITHFALTVQNLDELFLKMSKKNINFVNYPKISENKKYKVCFCQDYEGNFVELVEEL